MKIQNQDNKPIRSIKDWEKLAGPLDVSDWKPGNSSREEAMSWFRSGKPQLPAELTELFNSHALTRNLEVDMLLPECRIMPDNLPGDSGSNLAVVEAHTTFGKILIGISPETGKPPDDYINKYRKNARNPASPVPQRITNLLQSLFSRALAEDASLGNLSYTVLHSIAATVSEAHRRGADIAVFVMHEFIADSADNATRDQRKKDLEQFAFRLVREPVAAEPGRLLGPFFTAGQPTEPLFIGRAIVQISIPTEAPEPKKVEPVKKEETRKPPQPVAVPPLIHAAESTPAPREKEKQERPTRSRHSRLAKKPARHSR